MYRASRLVRCVAVALVSLVLLLAGHIQSAGAVEAAALAFDAEFEFVGCESVEGSFWWTDLPAGATIFLLAQDEAAVQENSYYLVDSFHNEGADHDGQKAFDLTFSSPAYDWSLTFKVFDSFSMLLLEGTRNFSRPCVTGSVSPGPTGNGSVEAIDSRSGDVAEPVEFGEGIDDPDDDGRVQVP